MAEIDTIPTSAAVYRLPQYAFPSFPHCSHRGDPERCGVLACAEHLSSIADGWPSRMCAVAVANGGPVSSKEIAEILNWKPRSVHDVGRSGLRKLAVSQGSDPKRIEWPTDRRALGTGTISRQGDRFGARGPMVNGVAPMLGMFDSYEEADAAIDEFLATGEIDPDWREPPRARRSRMLTVNASEGSRS